MPAGGRMVQRRTQMPDCREVESLLPPFVDGEADAATARRVEVHLAACAQCRQRVAAERTMRTVMRARRSELTVTAPMGLSSRIGASLREEARPGSRLSWFARATAFAGAAALVLIILTGLEFVSPPWNVLFAAQLAIDHVRCFMAEQGSTAPADPVALEKMYVDEYGWSVRVPPSDPSSDLTLVAARRCPYWLGQYSHLLYRTHGREVSLYATPGPERAAEGFQVLGHSERIWRRNGTTYALVAGGLEPAEIERLLGYFQRSTLP
jgi:anti-sigma factor (TIGR02949 family)